MNCNCNNKCKCSTVKAAKVLATRMWSVYKETSPGSLFLMGDYKGREPRDALKNRESLGVKVTTGEIFWVGAKSNSEVPFLRRFVLNPPAESTYKAQ